MSLSHTLPIVIENRKFRDQFYKGSQGLVKFIVAANFSTDVFVNTILSEFAELLSTARKLFRFASWYSLFPKLINSFYEERPSLLSYYRNVFIYFGLTASLMSDDYSFIYSVVKNESMKKNTQYFAAAFQSFALFLMLSQNLGKYLELHRRRQNIRYEGNKEEYNLKVAEVDRSYFYLYLDILKNISNFLGCVNITLPSLVNLGRKRLALTSVFGGFIGAYLTYFEIVKVK